MLRCRLVWSGWLCLLLASGCAGAGPEPMSGPGPAAPPLRVVSYNIRYGTANDGENHWRRRQRALLAQIRDFDAAVLGLQEALRFQIDAIAEVLPRHRWVGVDRRGGQDDEFTPIFFDHERLELVEHGQFWLAPDPAAVGQKGWDAALPRHCTFAVLAERKGGGRFLVGNAHFDHRGERARRESARVIVEQLLGRGLPTVLLGDLNCAEDSPALATLRQGGLVDAFRALHPAAAPDAEPAGTFHGFRGHRDGARIDFVLCSAAFAPVAVFVDHRGGAGPPYPSDHYAVVADLRRVP